MEFCNNKVIIPWFKSISSNIEWLLSMFDTSSHLKGFEQDIDSMRIEARNGYSGQIYENKLIINSRRKITSSHLIAHYL